MPRSLRLLLLAALAASPLRAQCHEPQIGPAIGSGDDVVLPMQALGFAFPFGGSTWTHLHASTNGFVYLSNAGVPAPGAALCCVGSATQLVAGAPKIAPYWSDLDLLQGVGAVHFQALPGRAVVTWRDAVELTDTTRFSCQLQLLASGEIRCAYDGRCAIRTPGDFLVGMSEGGGAAIPPARDFALPGASTTTTNFETFNQAGPVFDLAGRTLVLVPAGTGYAWSVSPCGAAQLAYGAGCYRLGNSFYHHATTAAAAAAALSNRAVTMTPNGSGYTVTSGGAFVPPSAAATVLALGDDTQVTTPPLAVPFPYTGGAAAAFVVCSNGFVSVAPGNGTGYAPDVGALLGNPQTAWYSWHDYDPTAPGSGAVKFEQAGAVATITWDGVYNYGGTSPADASRFQFRFDAASGVVTMAWQSVSPNPPGGFPGGEPHLAGFSPGGPSLDPGSMSFATGLPVTTLHVQQFPLTLAASPAAISNALTGSAVTYTTGGIPELAPGSGVHVAVHTMSFGALVPGLPLAPLGAPGCELLLATFDFAQAMVGTSPAQAMVLPVPPALPSGLVVFAQSAALFPPFSLPNGQNALGLLTSNGIATIVGSW